MSNFDNIGGIYAKDTELRQDIDDVKQLLGYEEEYAPQTKSRSANDTQYFTGIDVVENNSTILSTDVVDSDARKELYDLEDYVTSMNKSPFEDDYSFSQDGSMMITKDGIVSYISSINNMGLFPWRSDNKITIDWSQDWEVGVAFYIESRATHQYITLFNTPYVSGSSKKVPKIQYDIVNNEVWCGVSENGSTWTTELTVSKNCLAKWVFVKLAYSSQGNTLTVSVTDDFTNWETDTAAVSYTPYNDNSFFGYNCDYDIGNVEQFVRYDIYNTYIKQDDEIKWGKYIGEFIPRAGYQPYEQPWHPLEDGYSNFWFELTNDTLSPWLNFSAKNANATIDWGDGSGEQTLDTLTPTHTYSKAGKYVVKVKGVTGIGRQNLSSYYYKGYLGVLKQVELNSEVVSLATFCFLNCIFLEHIITPNVNSFGASFAQYCSALKSANISANVPSQAFGNCLSLSSITLASGITSLDYNALYQCISLQSITIPSTVISIGTNAFSNCVSLTEIHMFPTTPPTLGTTPFGSLPSNFIIYVPVGYGDTYKSAAGWSTYADHILEEGQQPNRAMLSKFNKETDEPQDDMR